MASSEVLEIERLDTDDVAGALALSDAAGWNQTGDDWRFFLTEGETFGVRDDAARLIASAAALPYDGAVGWVSMVLVDAGHRHRGLATRLLGACTESLRRAGRVPVLDATPDGAEVYRRLGFAAGFGFERWQGEGDAVRGAAPDAGVVVAATNAGDVDALVALDRATQGAGRERLLRDLLARPATRAWRSDDASGFVLSRVGRRATHIGPLIADDEHGARALAAAAMASARGPLFIDVPVHQAAFAQWLEGNGFTRQRSFVRMALGNTSCMAASARVRALAGPEFG